jgi:adenine-specific DNA-methyltransferase
MVAAIAGCAPKTWLEPGCGNGVFLQAMCARGIPRSNIQAVDLETARSDHDSCAKVLRGVDFLSWAFDNVGKFNCIVGNPPYVAIRELPEPLRSVAAHVLDHRGTPVGMRANTWYAFLQASVYLLQDGGNLAFVLPAACEYADYCEPGRASITQMFERVDLIRSKRPLFSYVQEGAAVLVCQNKGQHSGLFRRHEVSDLEETIDRLRQLSNHKARACTLNSIKPTRGLVRLGDVLSIRLGGVTGDAEYFTISEQRRRELRLPIGSVRPVLSKCRHIRKPWITERDWRLLKEAGQRVWLFNPRMSLTHNPAVRKYLCLDEQAGGCRRKAFKVRNRDPWYQTPLTSSPDGFISGMSPDGVWMCFNEMHKLNATNTLYVVHFRPELSLNQRFALALGFLTTEGSKRLRRSRRRYADGLEKIEPGQLADLEVPQFIHVTKAKQVYRKALLSLFNGDPRASRRLADRAFHDGECRFVH